ncbi:MAG: hypothetical protein QM714_05985 [Nocardioides sp.]|uniref:hypothetical protein n=1 Tax=Nocardioides sp. TaxID=35761 RepID=UPI0039E50A44
MTGEETPPEVGSLGEETAKLLGALAGWAREQGADLGAGANAAAAHAAASMQDLNEHLATDAAECRYCPICRAIELVRDTPPEVRAHLLTATTSLMHAAAALLATTVPDQRSGGSSRGPDVEHIDVHGSGDEGDWAEENGGDADAAPGDAGEREP